MLPDLARLTSVGAEGSGIWGLENSEPEVYMGTRVKRPSPAMIVAIVALVAALTGTAFAALGKNTVGSKQLKKNAVTTAKIKTNAVTEAKISNAAVSSGKLKENAVTSDKIAAGAVTGAKVDVSSLGKVPSATSADVASNLAGQQNFFIRLNSGQSQVIASHGSVSLVATCEQNVGGNDFVKVFGQTTLSGAIQQGLDNLPGPGGAPAEFLEPNTPPDKREFLAFSDATGEIDVGGNIGQGYVLGPDGKMIALNSEGVALGLNYGGSTCLTAGVVNLIG